MAPTLGDGLLASRVLLAHGGGAPEALTIAVPLLVVVGFVLAELRVRRRDRDDASEADAVGGPTPKAGPVPDPPRDPRDPRGDR